MEVSMSFMMEPQKSHSIISTIFYWHRDQLYPVWEATTGGYKYQEVAIMGGHERKIMPGAIAGYLHDLI